jgi:hypothetical protein
MRGKMIVVGSVTYAMKSKDLLFREGIKAYVERTQRTKEFGCGYGVVVPQRADTAISVLKQNHIKILAVVDAE